MTPPQLIPQDQTLIALKKAKTSIEKIIKMIEEGNYCINVFQQILAVQGLLRASSEKVMKKHLETCFSEGMSTTDKIRKEELIKELITAMKMSEKA